MKKIYKKLGAIGVASLPTATILSCAQVDEPNAGALDRDLINDQEVVNKIISDLKSLPLEVSSDSEGAKILPSKIKSALNLEGIIDNTYFYSPNGSITARITNYNDQKGTLTLELLVERGQVSQKVSFTFTGFLNVYKQSYQADVANAITYVENNPGEVTSYGKTILPTTITTDQLEDSIQNLPIYGNWTKPTIVATSQKGDDINGSLEVEFTVTRENVTDTVTMTYYGFLTINQRDQDIVDNELNNINKLPTEGSESAGEIYASEIQTETDLEKYVTLPTVTQGVEMAIANYDPDNLNGILNITYNLSKGDVKESTVVSYTGFQKRAVASSHKMEGIPDVKNGWVQPINQTHYLIGTSLEGIYQAEINPATGEVVKTKKLPMTKEAAYEEAARESKSEKVWVPSVAFGWSEKIDEAHYLIGTESDGVYQVTVNPDTGYVIETWQVSTNMGDEIAVPANTGSGFITKLVETGTQENTYLHYLIGSSYNYDPEKPEAPKEFATQITVHKQSGNIVKKHSIEQLFNPLTSLKDGWMVSITNDGYKFLVGATNSNIYEVTINPITEIDDIVLTAQQDAVWNESVTGGWIQPIGISRYYLVGTTQKGVYEIEVNNATGLINPGTVKPVPMKGDNSIPAVNTGWIQKLDDVNYLVGTYDQGVYWIKVNPKTGEVIKTSSIPISGEFSIPNVSGGFINKLDNTNNFLIGTATDGLHYVKINI